ncbi:MAG: hypothetical protein JSV65_07835 [Armatimonadota bacterium]|nr:MAG: hypothetical protein JSV65_07835 [Armatimonadota bacterium]
MARNRGWTVIALIGVVLLIVVLAVIFFPVFARKRQSRHSPQGVCLSNLKQIVLAALFYAQDYDEVLPACVADDRDGTAHAVGGTYANWKTDAFRADVTSRYGEPYIDGRWMWHLSDVLGPYVKSLDIFNCPTLTRQDPYFTVQTYAVGTDKRTGAPDPKDPLLVHMPGAGILDGRKTWQSGSYAYMCMHHPYGTGVRASDYGADFMALWDVAFLLGYTRGTSVLGADNPEDYLACGKSLSPIWDDLVVRWEPLLMCRSYGVHEEYTRAYAAVHAIPPELAPLFGLTEKQVTPTIPVCTPMAFVDGHAKYMRVDFYEFLALIVSPDRVEPASH